MKEIIQTPSVITADLALFGYLQEKTDERETRAEAYCDLLDKASAGYVSPFVKKSEVTLKPCQCHVTITDLSDQWKWHRATIRSFLERMEELGQIATDKQPKSVVITMPCDANTIRPHIGTPDECFAGNVSHILSEWASGQMAGKEVARRIGQLVNEAITAIDKDESASCTQDRDKSGKNLSDRIRHIAMTQIIKAIVQQAISSAASTSHNERTATCPLEEFFKEDLEGDWLSFMDASKMLAEVILNGDSTGLAGQSAASKAAFLALREPFVVMLAENKVSLYSYEH